METEIQLPTVHDRFPRGYSREFGQTDLDARLDDLVKQNPSLAEPLRQWREEPRHKRDQRREDKFEDLKAPLRRTVPDMQQRREDKDRNQRAQSAPPTSDLQNDSASSQSQSTTSEKEHSSASREPVVRHIPIFVEGRDEPIVNSDSVDAPRVAREPSPRRNVSETHASSDRPLHVPLASAHSMPSPSGGTSINIPVHYSGPTPKPHPAGGGTTIPIVVEAPGRSSSPNPPQGAPKPQPAAPKVQPAAAKPPPPAAPSPPPPKPAPVKLEPLDQVKAVQDEVSELQKQVDDYKGSGEHKDKQYMFLDEMLTRNLLRLDNIETEGREDVRKARRETIRTIQRAISILESKGPQPSTQDALKDQKLEVANQDAQLSGDVAEQKETGTDPPASS